MEFDYVLDILSDHMEEIASIILFGIGLSTLLLHRNLMKKIIGLNIMDTAAYLFLASNGYIQGRLAPIIVDNVMDMEAYINPVPSGLVLTGIVVSVSTSALFLSLTVRLYRRYHSLDLDKIMMEYKKEVMECR